MRKCTHLHKVENFNLSAYGCICARLRYIRILNFWKYLKNRAFHKFSFYFQSKWNFSDETLRYLAYLVYDLMSLEVFHDYQKQNKISKLIFKGFLLRCNFLRCLWFQFIVCQIILGMLGVPTWSSYKIVNYSFLKRFFFQKNPAILFLFKSSGVIPHDINLTRSHLLVEYWPTDIFEVTFP